MDFQPPDLNVSVGTASSRRMIAVRHRPGAAPGLFWLGGFNSRMDGTKATALDASGARWGAAVTRFDYSGCGASAGDFAQGTISRWLDEAAAVFAQAASGPQVLVGSSMGAWLALLLNRRLQMAGGARAVKALVLIAPAVDMTEQLLLAGMNPTERGMLARDGQILRPSNYGGPLVVTQALIGDGAQHCLLNGPIETGCPVHIIHGARDHDVPRAHAMRLMSHLLHDEVSFTLVPDGDHRLSRAEDLARIETIVRMARED